jgi:hypothetical protein
VKKHVQIGETVKNTEHFFSEDLLDTRVHDRCLHISHQVKENDGVMVEREMMLRETLGSEGAIRRERVGQIAPPAPDEPTKQQLHRLLRWESENTF